MTLIPRPDKLPEWASEDHTDPSLPIPNVVEPDAIKKKKGWFYKEPPPANWFNWILRYCYRWTAFFDDQRTNSNPVFGIDTSVTQNLLTVTLTPAATQYTDGRLFIISIANTNSDDSYINVNGLGTKQIVDIDGKTLGGAELLAGSMCMLVYSLANDKFMLQTKPAAVAGFRTGGVAFETDNTPRDGWMIYDPALYSFATFGDASSGADIRADNDCSNLFKLWWTNFPALAIFDSAGNPSIRTTAEDDWAAHKRLGVVNFFDHVIGGAGVNAFGAEHGWDSHINSGAEMYAHGHVVSDPTHGHTTRGVGLTSPGGGDRFDGGGSSYHDSLVFNSASGVSVQPTGGGVEWDIRQRTIYLYVSVKL